MQAQMPTLVPFPHTVSFVREDQGGSEWGARLAVGAAKRPTRGRQAANEGPASGQRGAYEQPVVDPQVSQRMHVPLRTRVKCPHTGHASPS